MSQLDRLYRRILMMVAPVKITATDDSGPVHRAQVRVTPRETIDDVPVMQIYGLASHAPAGSDGHAVFISGNRSSAVIVATNNQTFRLRGLKSGEVALYTDEGDSIRFARGKIVQITSGAQIQVSAPVVNITGAGGGNTAIHVTGSLTATGAINAPQGHVGP